MLSAAELHQRGLDASTAGHHATARKTFQQALARATDNETRARIELSLAYTEGELGTIDDGVQRCHHALGLPGVPERVQGLIWSQLGLLHMRAGDGGTAHEELDRAKALLDPAEHRPLGTLYLTLGNIHLQRSEADAAIECFHASSTHYLAADLPWQADKAVHNLGYARLLAGDVVGAIQLMDRARSTFEKLGPVYEAVGNQDRAEALVAAGMPHDAARALRAAATAFARRRMRKRQAEAQLVLARLLLREDPTEARRVARRAMRGFTANGSDVWALRAEAVSIEAEVLAGGRGPELIPAARRVSARLRDRSLIHDATALELQSARVALRRGDVAAARRQVRDAHDSDDAPLPNRLLAHQVRAELSAAAGDDSASMAQAREGLASLHSWQSTFGSLDLQSSLVGHGRELALHGLRTALRVGTPEVLFEWSERARALAARVMPVRPTVSTEHAEQLQRLRDLSARIDAAAAAGRPDADLVGQARALRRTIREHAWDSEGSGVVLTPVSLPELQARLADRDGVLLAHVVVDTHVYALVVGPRDAQVLDLGKFADVQRLLGGLQADLDVSAAHLPAPLHEVAISSLHGRLATLAERLTTPAAHLIGDRPVVVVPSGPLSGVPWTLLDGLIGVPVTIARSATLWQRRHSATQRPTVAVFAAGPNVTRADEEVRRAAGAWHDASLLTGPDATTGRVSSVAPRADVLHIAAHGRHSGDNPLFSGLELQDGLWFGYDIDRLTRVPQVVVLSACELGRSTVRWGEEAIGMPTAWLHAGSRVVIASPASVDDDVACEVLSATHALLAEGLPAADALAEATGRHGTRAPSTFMCFGTGW